MNTMAIYTVKLKGRQEIAFETMAFHFDKPEGFAYKAGQWGDFLTNAMLRKFIDDFSLPIYYISGPKAMVGAMRKVLNESGVRDGKIRTEQFSGY
jgi:ferredoxin-NADP reductase